MTKFKIDLHKMGDHTEAIVRMVCNHNEGNTTLTLEIVRGYVLAKKAQWPTLSEGRTVVLYDYADSISISSDEGKTVYLTLTEYEVEQEIPELNLPTNDTSITQL